MDRRVAGAFTHKHAHKVIFTEHTLTSKPRRPVEGGCWESQFSHSWLTLRSTHSNSHSPIRTHTRKEADNLGGQTLTHGPERQNIPHLQPLSPVLLCFWIYSPSLTWRPQLVNTKPCSIVMKTWRSFRITQYSNPTAFHTVSARRSLCCTGL